MEAYAEYLVVAKEAASLAGEILQEAWDKPRSVKHKGTVDLVRDTPRLCINIINIYRFPACKDCCGRS